MRVLKTVLVVAAAISSTFPASASLLCRENLEQLDMASVLRQETRWMSKAGMTAQMVRVREICEERHGADCERNGVFGPGSMMWEVSRVPFLALFAETELYLQLAHPVGAQGVFDHSQRLMQDPVTRFQSTFNHLWNMTYGTFTDAERIARIVHLHHSKVVGILEDTAGASTRGEIYSATDPSALLWVHATHMYSLLKLYETLERKLDAAEKERFYADSKLFGMLMGIPENLLPGTKAEFESYFNSMLNSTELEYSGVAQRMEAHFRAMSGVVERQNPLLRFVREYSDTVTAVMLPPQFAERFGLRASARKEAVVSASLTAMKAAYRRMPTLLRELPLYRTAMARAQGRTPSWLDEKLYKTMIGLTYARLKRSMTEVEIAAHGKK